VKKRRIRMNKIIIAAVSFFVGFSAGVWYQSNKETNKETKELIERNEKLRKETDEIIEKMKRNGEETDEIIERIKRDSDDYVDVVDEAIKIMNEMGYSNQTKKEFNRINPYLIDSNDFGEYDEYEQIYLTYFADGVLTDEQYEIIENPEELVGDFKSLFGTHDNVICIRCDERCADYEIAKDVRTYAQVYNELPHMRWRDDE
jgi:hypothetical protein